MTEEDRLRLFATLRDIIRALLRNTPNERFFFLTLIPSLRG